MGIMQWNSNILFLLLHVLNKLANSLSPPDFVSDWKAIEAYRNPEVMFDLNFSEMPMKVDVQLKVSHPGHGDIYFLASGSGQAADTAKPFGGVIYLYNNMQVKVMAPGPKSCPGECKGGVAFLGDSGFRGPTTTTTGVIKSGMVRVRAWKTCTFIKPSFISDEFSMNNDNEFYLKHTITTNEQLDLVMVKVFFDDGWIMDAQGTVASTEASSAVGGVQFTRLRKDIYIRTPKNPGKMFNGINWGNDGTISKTSGKVRIYAWVFMHLKNNPSLETTIIPGSTNPVEHSLKFDPTGNNTILIVEMTSTDDTNYGLRYVLSGSAMTDGSSASEQYGSFFYAYDANKKLYFWKPILNSGCSGLIGGNWAMNLTDKVSDCSKVPDIYVKFLKAEIAELPCGARGCTGKNNGPHCDCQGTGYEGQYCDIPIKCDRFKENKDVLNADFHNKKYTYQETANFQCKDGYIYNNGSYSRTCQADGTYSGTPFTCDPVTCPNPEPATNGNINNTFNKWYLEKVIYQCNNGFDRLSGNSVRVCQADGKWNGDALECARSCGLPNPPPLNAHQTNFGLTHGVTATYECDTGYEYSSGDLARLCQNTGVWNGTAVKCTRVACGQPENGTNTILNIEGTLFGDSATYTCLPGYDLPELRDTYVQRRCRSDRQWSGPAANCSKINCEDPGIPVNAVKDLARSDTTSDYMSVWIYACHLGYGLMSGSLTIKCTQYGNWSNNPPTCEVRTCQRFNNVSNAQSFYHGFNYNAHVVTVCDPGYALKTGTAVQICDENGQWTGGTVTCEKIEQIIFFDPNRTASSTILPNASTITRQNIPLIKIHFKNTTRYKRSLESQNDGRTSSLVIGIVCSCLALSFVLFICFLDVIKLEHLIEHLIENDEITESKDNNSSEF